MFNVGFNYIECVLQEGLSKRSVTLQIGQTYLAIDNKSWSFNDIKIERGGNKDNMLFIHLSENQTVYFELTSQNREILQRDPQTYTFFKSLAEKKNSQHKLELVIAFSFLMLICGIIYYRAIIFSQLSILVPFSVEKKIGDKILKI